MILMRIAGLIAVFVLASAAPSFAAGVREFTRTPAGTAVSPSQATELTLTLTDTATRPIQHWVRTAGTPDAAGKVLSAFVRSPEAEMIEVGQRLRAFSVASRARMTQGRIASVVKQPGGVRVMADLPAAVPNDGSKYVMEIVADHGSFLSIPNVSIIEEGDKRVVYVQEGAGNYQPRIIETGVQGELYTQILSGLNEGDQVVSVGSFFVDAENKLKSVAMAAMPGMDHGAMPGMDHGAPPSAAAPTGGPPAPAQLLMTDPAPNASVKAPLMMIHVMFNAPVDPKASGFTVTKGDGTAVDVGEAMAMGGDGKMLMAMPKTPLPAGRYNVKWHTVGGDGKKLEGQFSFTAQ